MLPMQKGLYKIGINTLNFPMGLCEECRLKNESHK